MKGTLPAPGTGSNEEKERIRSIVASRGLTGAANDTKWGQLLDAMRTREGWRPPNRLKCVDGPPSGWDAEWHHHLPFPMMSVEWMDVSCRQVIPRGALIEPEVVDHSDWIEAILIEAKFCYDVVGDMIRIHGYLPKSFEGLDANPELTSEVPD